MQVDRQSSRADFKADEDVDIFTCKTKTNLNEKLSDSYESNTVSKKTFFLIEENIFFNRIKRFKMNTFRLILTIIKQKLFYMKTLTIMMNNIGKNPVLNE